MTDFVIVGNPDSRRVALFQSALACLKLPSARVISYLDLLSGRASLTDAVRPGTIVRIESPGKDFEVERALLMAGAEAEDAAEDGDYERITRQAAHALTFERGRILYPRQWYLGWCEVLRLIERQLAACPAHRLMNAPAEIAVMFDKPQCHELLSRHGIPVPRSLGVIRSFNELIERMRETRCPRVFIKLAHGSSASGVVAYQTDGQRHRATTTVEMTRQGGELCLYNSRRLRIYREFSEIAELIDTLCRHRVHVEQWLPKAGYDNQTFDLRVVVIAGQVKHIVVRLSRSPMTNLHLLNERGDASAVIARMGATVWEGVRRSCESAMRCFADSLYAGIDLMITADYRRSAVLEVNAFGDLLPGVLWEGRDTYTAEVMAALVGAGTQPSWTEGSLERKRVGRK